MTTTNTNSPLSSAVFHILLALSSGERHGYGIMKQVQVDSQGKVNMGPGPLYGSLKRMLDAGLVEESDKRIDPEMDDERRIYYQITGLRLHSNQKFLTMAAAQIPGYNPLDRLVVKKSFLCISASGLLNKDG
jgi:hypothetical protein